MNTYPVKNSNVIIRQEEEGKSLALNQENQLLLVMNSTALFIWNLCDGKNSVDDIERKIREAYNLEGSGINEDDLHGHIERFLPILEKAELLSPSNEKDKTELSVSEEG